MDRVATRANPLAIGGQVLLYGVFVLVIASEALSRGYAPAPLGLCFAGSDAGDRAAIVFGSV